MTVLVEHFIQNGRILKGIFTLLLLITHLVAMADKQELQVVVQSNSQFTKQLYNILAKKEGNIFFSPISAHIVLAMSFQGSKGTTYEAFVNTLGISNASLAAEGYNTLLGSLNNLANIELAMANRIYVMQGFTLKPTFQDIFQTKYLSDVEPVNFQDSQGAAKKINGWVGEKTKNKIKDIVLPDTLGMDTRMVLVNAIYFKGSWATKFDAKNTRTNKFYLNDDDFIHVHMMRNKGMYLFKDHEHLDAKVLELPYLNPDLSLIVILPNKRNGIGDLEKKLTDFDLTKITENIHKRNVEVKLPRFKIETTIDLNDPLKELGLGIIFKGPDFSEMFTSSEPLVVSQVIQKAFIEVNEEGTEAAAATARTIMVKSGPRKFTANHPFIFILAFQKQTVLFYGCIKELPQSDDMPSEQDEEEEEEFKIVIVE